MMPLDAPQDTSQALSLPVDSPNAPDVTGAFVADDSLGAFRICAGHGCVSGFVPKRKRQRFAPGHVGCRRRFWESKHPRLPRKHPKACGQRKLKPTAKAILAMLRQGPMKVTDLWYVAGPGFSTRVAELRAKGHRVVYDPTSKLYSLAS